MASPSLFHAKRCDFSESDEFYCSLVLPPPSACLGCRAMSALSEMHPPNDLQGTAFRRLYLFPRAIAAPTYPRNNAFVAKLKGDRRGHVKALGKSKIDPKATVPSSPQKEKGTKHRRYTVSWCEELIAPEIVSGTYNSKIHNSFSLKPSHPLVIPRRSLEKHIKTSPSSPIHPLPPSPPPPSTSEAPDRRGRLR